MNLKSLAPVPLLTTAATASRQAAMARSGGVGGDDGDAGDDHRAQEEPLFLVKVKHREGSGGYALQVRLEPREDVRDVFLRHRLTAIRVYVDEAREREIEDRQRALREAKRKGYRDDPDLLGVNTRYFLSPGWMWTTVRQAYAANQHGRVLRIGVGDLLDGVTLNGSLEYLHDMERVLLAKVDWLAARIAHGVAFDGQEIAIYAPGKPRKATTTEDPGTPPNEWRP